MRLMNCRFLCKPRRLRNIVILVLTVVLIVNFILVTFHEKPREKAPIPTILSRSNDRQIHTKLRTKIPCPSQLRLLILVSSNLGHSDRRMLIRNTWGPDNSLRMRWRTVFLLTENDNQKEKRIAQVESDLYGDIVTGEYQEAFFNMAFKVAMGFEWALKFCKFDYLLKTDDDIFVNTHGLLDYLDLNSTLKEKLYTGNPMVGSPVLRVGRYRVRYASGEKRDDETNKTMFAPYCSGGGFLLSNDVVRSVLNFYDLTHPLNIDDAYIGELAERAGVKPLINSKNFRMYADRCDYTPVAFVQHPAKTKCLEELYRQHVKYLLTGELETPKPTPPPTKGPTNPPAKAPQNAIPGKGPAPQNAIPGKGPAPQNAIPGKSPVPQKVIPGKIPATQSVIPGKSPVLQNVTPGKSPAPLAKGTQKVDPPAQNPTEKLKPTEAVPGKNPTTVSPVALKLNSQPPTNPPPKAQQNAVPGKESTGTTR